MERKKKHYVFNKSAEDWEILGTAPIGPHEPVAIG